MTVRDVLGHADLKTTERYLHAVRASRLADAATRAFTPEPAPSTRAPPHRPLMPRISVFYGIAIYMYWNEGHHARPHFHARYGGRAASIDFDGNPIAEACRPGH